MYRDIYSTPSVGDQSAEKWSGCLGSRHSDTGGTVKEAERLQTSSDMAMDQRHGLGQWNRSTQGAHGMETEFTRRQQLLLRYGTNGKGGNQL